jgi:TctA family transporter
VAETAHVPLLSFGIPGSNSTAILLGGFLNHGIVLGPMLFQRSGEVVHGLYAGLFVAAIIACTAKRVRAVYPWLHWQTGLGRACVEMIGRRSPKGQMVDP